MGGRVSDTYSPHCLKTQPQCIKPKNAGGLRDGLAMGQSIQILKKTLAGANVNKRVSRWQVRREVVLVSSSIFFFGEASFDR